MARQSGVLRQVGMALVLIGLATSCSPGGGEAPPEALVEECGIRIAGAGVLADGVMPALTAEFLAASGYAPEEPVQTDRETIIVGRREGAQCTLTIASSTAYDGLRELAAGTARIALAGRPINDRDIAALREAGAGDFEVDRARAEHVVALDAIAVVAHADNPARLISADQIRDIAFGVLNNWQALGGQDRRIALYLPLEGNRAEDFPNDAVTTRHPIFESIGERASLFSPDSALFPALAQDPAGLTLVSLTQVPAEGFKILAVSAGPVPHEPSLQGLRDRTYPLARRLFFYVRPDALDTDPFVQRFLAFTGGPQAAAVFEAHNLLPMAAPMVAAADDAQTRLRCLFGTPEAAAVNAAIRGADRFDEPLHFAPGGVALDQESQGRIAELAQRLNAEVARGASVVLIGHSDAQGEPEINRQVALRRAMAAREALEANGVFGIVVESAGEMCHVTDNATQSGLRLNQRVEIWVRPPESSAPTAAGTPQ